MYDWIWISKDESFYYCYKNKEPVCIKKRAEDLLKWITITYTAGDYAYDLAI